MTQITVNELLKECKKQVAKGNGNKVIIISNDDEGNGYHPLFYSFSEDVKEFVNPSVSGINPDDDLDNVIILG